MNRNNALPLAVFLILLCAPLSAEAFSLNITRSIFEPSRSARYGSLVDHANTADVATRSNGLCEWSIASEVPFHPLLVMGQVGAL